MATKIPELNDAVTIKCIYFIDEQYQVKRLHDIIFALPQQGSSGPPIGSVNVICASEEATATKNQTIFFENAC
jgi:hypothetical protein